MGAMRVRQISGSIQLLGFDLLQELDDDVNVRFGKSPLDYGTFKHDCFQSPILALNMY